MKLWVLRFIRLLKKAELRVKIAFIVILLFLTLTILIYFFSEAYYLLLILVFLIPFYEGSKKGDSKIPNKKDNSWIGWLQIEWLYQNYSVINSIMSLELCFIRSFQLFSQGYSIWMPIISAFMSVVFFPLALLAILRILKKDEFQTPRSRFGRVCFMYFTETLMNLNKMREAVSYMRYALEMLDKQCQEKGFRAESVQKTVFLLEILGSGEVSYPDKLKELTSILANSHTVDEYVKHLSPFLADLKWFEDVKSVPPVRRLSLVKKIATSGVTVALLSWFFWTYQNEIKDLISRIIIPILVSHEFLLWVLPASILLPLFFYLTKPIESKYRITLPDLEATTEYMARVTLKEGVDER